MLPDKVAFWLLDGLAAPLILASFATKTLASAVFPNSPS